MNVTKPQWKSRINPEIQVHNGERGITANGNAT